MSDINVKSASPDFLSSGLERLRGPKSHSIEQEKARLKKATQEFESFFTYQMLKTMRQTIPESPFSKNSPMSTDMGKETFTDIFDMEIARKMSSGKSQSVSEMLYNSLEKLLQREYDAANEQDAEIKPLTHDRDNFINVSREAVPIPKENVTIPLNPQRDGIGLEFHNETNNAQDLSKNPKAP